MRFHAPSVSASADGDYYQLCLGPAESGEEENDPFEVKGPYLIVQRDFESPDTGRCYVETHDDGYVGHFPVRLAEFSRTRLAIALVRKTNNHIEVTFALSAAEFEAVQRVAEIIFGLREPDWDGDVG